jgi:hypothetical protein
MPDALRLICEKEWLRDALSRFSFPTFELFEQRSTRK